MRRIPKHRTSTIWYRKMIASLANGQRSWSWSGGTTRNISAGRSSHLAWTNFWANGNNLQGGAKGNRERPKKLSMIISFVLYKWLSWDWDRNQRILGIQLSLIWVHSIQRSMQLRTWSEVLDGFLLDAWLGAAHSFQSWPLCKLKQIVKIEAEYSEKRPRKAAGRASSLQAFPKANLLSSFQIISNYQMT